MSTRCIAAIARMEKIIQRDEGQRGIKNLCQPAGTLAALATSLFASRSVVLVTGFPCLIQHDPPTETDGPSGTIAIARALTRMGTNTKVTIVTDQCNAKVLELCATTALTESPAHSWQIVSFPPKDQWNEIDQHKLEQLAATADHVVALERASQALDGNAYTMSGTVMGNDLLAPLDQLFQELRSKYTYTTSRVGDGGNELGMAGARAEIVQHIKNGGTIASASRADHLLVASVSNWGGYSIAAALEAIVWDATKLSTEAKREGDAVDVVDVVGAAWPLLPPDNEELLAVEAAVRAGARDGVSGKQEVSVDGMSMEVSLSVLRELRNELTAYVDGYPD